MALQVESLSRHEYTTSMRRVGTLRPPPDALISNVPTNLAVLVW